jgi:adenosine deaminase
VTLYLPRSSPITVDCHRHLGGCISPAFVWDSVEATGDFDIAESLKEVVEQMSFAAGEQPGFHHFLDKFRILDLLQWSPDLLRRAILQICQHMEVDYAWIRFSLNKYAGIGWSPSETVQFIAECFEAAAPGRVGLLLSLKYESPRASQRHYAELLADDRMMEILAGMDLVGDEAYWDKEFYAPIVAAWREAGKVVCAHVGESQPAKNIRDALEIGIHDICHGIHILDTPELIPIARELGAYFHTTVTSNYLTGVLPAHRIHPSLAMLEAGLNVTIGTDDPVQCTTTLDREFAILAHQGATPEQLAALRQHALDRVTAFSPALRMSSRAS